MAVLYGVLRGKVDRWKREDPPPGQRRSPHLQIRVLDGRGDVWRVPVNVRSQDGSKVIFHRSDPLISHAILEGLGDLRTGFTDLRDGRHADNSLDYLRAPLFAWESGLALPPTGDPNVADDDLQDVVGGQLARLMAAGGEVFAFGSVWRNDRPRPGIDEDWNTKNGVHDIHMNQGNARGQFFEDNGVFQDGGLILKFPGHFTGLFFRFLTQHLPTDGNGARTPDAREVPAGATPGVALGGGRAGAGGIALPGVYIEKALVNPAGDDTGKEIVVVGNTTLRAVDLSGWIVLDKHNNAEPLGGLLLPPGGSVSVLLSGRGAQLANRGGTIRLVDPAGTLIHAVSYGRDDAVEGRFVRFAN